MDAEKIDKISQAVRTLLTIIGAELPSLNSMRLAVEFMYAAGDKASSLEEWAEMLTSRATFLKTEGDEEAKAAALGQSLCLISLRQAIMNINQVFGNR